MRPPGGSGAAVSKPCMYCHALIVFVKLDTGRPIPVEPVPYPDKGNVAAIRNKRTGVLTGYVISQTKPLLDGYERFMPHRATCHPEKPRVTAPNRAATLFD